MSTKTIITSLAITALTLLPGVVLAQSCRASYTNTNVESNRSPINTGAAFVSISGNTGMMSISPSLAAFANPPTSADAFQNHFPITVTSNSPGVIKFTYTNAKGMRVDGTVFLNNGRSAQLALMPQVIGAMTAVGSCLQG